MVKKHFHKANATYTEPVASMKLIFDIPLPALPDPPVEVDFDAWKDKRQILVTNEAHEIADALFAVCPGSVMDALLIELLRRNLNVLSGEAHE